MIKKILAVNQDLQNGSLPIQYHHLAFYFLLVCIIPHSGFWFDLNSDWPRWSAYAFEHGLGNIYNSDTNYMPLYLHGLYWFGKLQGSRELIYQNSYQLKYFFLLFDFAGALAITWALQKYHQKTFREYFLLFNVGYLYCTTIWGQLDSVPTTFVILAIICLFERHLLWAAFFCTISVYAKLQAIIFIPFFLILLAIQLSKKWDIVLIIKLLGVFILTNLAMVLPFILNDTFDNFIKVVRESVGFFPKVSWNAYNLWYLLTSQDPTQLFDTIPFMGLTYKKWGFILFFSLATIYFIPLLKQSFEVLKNRIQLDRNYYQLLWLTMGAITILFFYVNTQMHERYSYPAIAFYFGYALLSGRYALFFIVSVAHLFNVDGVNQYIGINPFKPEIVALIFGGVLLISLFRVFQELYLSQSNEK
jgi:Gpi18-like mannosyltransferase